jgi:hypothetical protein
MAPERCPDCLRDATHTLYWYPRTRTWQSSPLVAAQTRRQSRYGRYCRWHAIVRVVQRNARGIVPSQQEAPHGTQEA